MYQQKEYVSTVGKECISKYSNLTQQVKIPITNQSP